MAAIGVLGTGLYLPPEIRRNDWWPARVVARWPPMHRRTDGSTAAATAMNAQAADPFQGAVERRVMPKDMSMLDMEVEAATAAIAQAGIDPRSIDAVLTQTMVPPRLLGNPACELHHRLGLARSCFATQVDAAMYSFVAQLSLAHALIASGQARCALLVQSCGASRLLDYDSPISPLFGDGATAVVVGQVADTRGILATAHFTEGIFPNTLAAGVPGGAWWDAGRGVLHIADRQQMDSQFLRAAEVCTTGIHSVLDKIREPASAVGFLCMHQGTSWLQRVVQEQAGLHRARTIDSFASTGYLFAAMLPAALAIAGKERMLRDDDLVVICGGGTGITYGAIALRWGR